MAWPVERPVIRLQKNDVLAGAVWQTQGVVYTQESVASGGGQPASDVTILG